jgi:hypothetical protein
LTPDDLADEEAAVQKDELEAEAEAESTANIEKAQQAYKDIKKRLGRAKRFANRTKTIFNRTKEFAGKVSELKDDFSVENLNGVTKLTKSKTYKLRLLCGITFETVVEYTFTEKEYGPKMKKLAQVGSVIASCAIKIGTFANPIGKIAGFFGYPVPEIPVEKIEGFKDFLDEVIGDTDAQGEWAALKEQADQGMDLDAINEFGDLLQKLIDGKCGKDWRGKLVQWEDPNNAGMVTFIDQKQYPKHEWNSGAVSGDETVGVEQPKLFSVDVNSGDCDGVGATADSLPADAVRHSGELPSSELPMVLAEIKKIKEDLKVLGGDVTAIKQNRSKGCVVM